MLARRNRLTRPEDFRRTIRSGAKAVASTVVIHGAVTPGVEEPPLIGVTVSKAVGGSVTRHRVARQIRHAIARELPTLPPGSKWVVRALPEAGPRSTSGSTLTDDVAWGVGVVRGKLT